MSLKNKSGETMKTNSFARKEILAAFGKLNPDYVVTPNTIDEILKALPSCWLSAPTQKQANFYQPCSLNTASAEAAKIRLTAKKLKEFFEKIHSTTFISLVDAGLKVEELQFHIDALISASSKAGETLAFCSTNFPEWAHARTGRPQAVLGLYIAKLLAEEYYRATGLFPTVSNHEVTINAHQKGSKAYGAFLDLVSAVFGSLEINAGSESMARQAEDFWKKRKDMLASIEEARPKSKEKSPTKIGD